MHVLVTAGPTREYIDSIRYISNDSSGRMGYAVAEEAVASGHDVTLLSGPVSLSKPKGVELIHFTSVKDLKTELDSRFVACDALVMSAAVGDFSIQNRKEGKISRREGPIILTLEPTEDLVAACGNRKTDSQKIVVFSVEDESRENAVIKARGELKRKGADFCVVNTPAAMGSDDSDACLIDLQGVLLEWAMRSKRQLAREIVSRLEK